MSSGVEVSHFAGLRLLADPEDVGLAGATSMLNADIHRDKTIVGSRSGMTRLATGANVWHRGSQFGGQKIALMANASLGLVMQILDVTTGTFGTPTLVYGSSSTYCTSMLSLPTSNSVVVCSRSASTNEQIRVLTGSGGGSTLSQAPRYVALSPTDARQLYAHYSSSTGTPSGANGTPSTLFFTSPGQTGPTPTFNANDFVAFFPSDGEEITGMAVWQDLTFVIKRSRMFVIYDTSSTDSNGDAVLRFRDVSLPSFAQATANRGGENIVAGPDGVYLLLEDGVYRTTGNSPVKISHPISPIFDGTGASNMIFPQISNDWTFGVHADRIYLSYYNNPNYRTLVFDTTLGEWLLWDLTGGTGALPAPVFTWINAQNQPVGYVVSGTKIFYLNPSVTSDDGTAITSSYRTGFWNPGQPGTESFIRETLFDGTGTVTSKRAINDATTLGTGATVVMGSSPAVAQGRDRRGLRARNVSFEISATGPWSISRITPVVWSQSAPAKKAA